MQVLSERIFDLGLRSWDMDKENFEDISFFWLEPPPQGGASIWWHCKWGIDCEWGGKGYQVYSSITLPYGDSGNIIKNMLQEFEKEKPISDGYFKPCMGWRDNTSNFVIKS